jgi:hypothetical protein
MGAWSREWRELLTAPWYGGGSGTGGVSRKTETSTRFSGHGIPCGLSSGSDGDVFSSAPSLLVLLALGRFRNENMAYSASWYTNEQERA